MLPADYRKHAITFLSFWGKEELSTQENLFEVIQRFARRFVVDNNVDWLELSAAPENADTAFVLGTTADKEAWRLRALLETPDGTPKIRLNVFMFGWRSPTPKDILCGHRTPLLLISRLDEHLTKILDMDGLRKFDQQAKGKAKWDTSTSIAEEKTKVLALLGVSRIGEAAEPKARRVKDEALKMSIELERNQCFKDFWKSNDVSRYGYARLLLASRSARNEFADVDYPHVFGDRYLVQNALFLKAGILSRDNSVKKMARFCGLPCFDLPR